MWKYNLGVATLLLGLVALVTSDCELCDCQQRGTIKTVDCSNRYPKLTEQPSGPDANTGRFDLSDNELTTLDTDTFYRLTELTRLDLNKNRLTTVDISALASLPKLNRLDLQDNQIASFEGVSDLTDTTALKNIFLKNNPLICDCSLLKFRDWARDKAVNLHQATCGPDNSAVAELEETGFSDGTCKVLLPPGPVTVTFVTSYGATVSWSPSTTGAPAISYRISLVPDFDGVQIIPKEVTATEVLRAQLTSLTPGRRYTVVVESVNDAITSGSSDKVFTTIPLSPRDVTVRSVQNTDAFITWSPPNAKSEYSGYNLSFNPPDTSIIVSPPNLGRSQRSARLSNLTTGTAYTFNILTTSGEIRSIPVMRSFTTLSENCSICSNVTNDDSCFVRTCSAGEDACQTRVVMLDKQWKISKQCTTMAGCQKPTEIQGMGFTNCCSGKKAGLDACNSYTNFTAWVAEVPLVVVLTLKPEIASDDVNLDQAFRNVATAVDTILTIGEKTFDSTTRKLTYAVTGSFLKKYVDYFIKMMNTAMSLHMQRGGLLAPYAEQATVTQEKAKCPGEAQTVGQGYQWPSVAVGETAQTACLDGEGSATRQCLQILDSPNVEWGQPDTSNCKASPKCDPDTMMANGQSYRWPQSLVGSTAVLPCSPDDPEKNSVLRPCSLTGLGASWGTADFSQCQQTEPNCTAEETTEGGETYAWPPTKVGNIAQLPCPDNAQKSVARKCEPTESGAAWAMVDTSQCDGVKTCAAEQTKHGGQSYNWPATVVGASATAPCSVDDQLNQAVRNCHDTGSGPRWQGGGNFEACETKPIMTFCPAENITTDRGQFTWPETETRKTTRVQCPLTDKPRTAFRRCLPSEVAPIWEEPNVVSCPRINDQATDTLRALNARPVTIDNVVFVTTAMAEISQNTTGITSEDVSLIGQLIDSVVQSESAFDWTVQSESSMELVAAVSNLMSMDIEQLGPAERKNKTIKNVVHSMEEFAQGLSVVQNRPVTLVQGDLAISSVKVRKGQTVSVAVKANRESLQKSDVMVGVAADKTMSGVSLPGELFSAQDGKAAFVIYNKNTFFQAMASSDGQEPETLPVGIIISAAVASKRENLVSPLEITINHPTRAANETPRCVYWDFSSSNGRGNWSTRGCRVGRATNTSTVCECDHMTNFALLMDVYGMGEVMTGPHQDILSVLSLVGCALSLLGLIMTVITYLMFRRKLLKNMPSKILLNLCFALIGVNAIFLGGTHYTVDDAFCKIVAGLLHYFLLASFCWMLVEAFYMYLSLVRVFQTYFSKLIWKFCVFAWGTPLLVVIITISISRENYSLQNEKICWLPPLAFYISFMAPLVLILVSNFIAFIMVMYQLRAVITRKKLTRAETQTTASQLRAALSILVLLGLTWLFGFLAIGGATIVFAYLFAIFNTLQGLFIFIFYCVWKRDVQIAWMRSLSCCPDVDESTSKNSSTAAYRKSKGSFGTTFTSFQRDSTPQRKFSESTQITDQASPSTTTFAHVNNHNVYGDDVKFNGNGNGDVNNVNVNTVDDYDVCGLDANTIDLSLEPDNVTSHDDVMTKSVEVEETNATVV